MLLENNLLKYPEVQDKVSSEDSMTIYQSTQNHITEDILTDKSVVSGLTMSTLKKKFSNSKIMNRLKIIIYMESQCLFMNSTLRAQFLAVFTRRI